MVRGEIMNIKGKVEGSDKKPIVIKTNIRGKRKYMASFKMSKPYSNIITS